MYRLAVIALGIGLPLWAWGENRAPFRSPALAKWRQEAKIRLTAQLSAPVPARLDPTKTALKSILEHTGAAEKTLGAALFRLGLVMVIDAREIHGYSPAVVETLLIALEDRKQAERVIYALVVMPRERFTASVREALLEVADDASYEPLVRTKALYLLATVIQKAQNRYLKEDGEEQDLLTPYRKNGALSPEEQRKLDLSLWPLLSPDWGKFLMGAIDNPARGDYRKLVWWETKSKALQIALDLEETRSGKAILKAYQPKMVAWLKTEDLDELRRALLATGSLDFTDEFKP